MKFKNWRANLVLFFLIIFGVAIIGRLFFLEVLKGKFYQAQALGQQTGFSETKGRRGEIFFQNSQQSKGEYATGEAKSLAISQDNWIVAANTDEILDKEKFADTLSPVIGEEKGIILSKITADSGDSYVIIKKSLPNNVLEKVKKLNLSGLLWQDDSARYYPQEDMASKVVGFFGGDENGQYGLEGYYEDILKGKSGIEWNKLDGSDIYLTIDYNIQFEAESLLKKAKEELNIDSGQIIVLKPDTGRIVALADYPNFNPNEYSKETNFEIFQNSALQKIFEPGSVLKPFTMAIALNEGKVTPQTTFTDTGSVKIGPQVLSNYDKKKYGKVNMSGILEKSINTGAVFLSQQVSHETFLNYLDKFGFFEKTNVDLQGEVYSANSILKNGPDVGFATAAFGQGIEITPLQLISGFAALANGGKLAKPYVVDKIVNGQDELKTKPEVSSESIVSSKTLFDLTTMLVSVVDNGFGKTGQVPGYYLAAKTGTAQIPLQNGRGYDPNRTIQSFIGFGPAWNPQFVILVKLDDPKVSLSSVSAGPIFKQMAQYILNYWQIPPDY